MGVLKEVFADSAALHGDAPALADARCALTYRELDQVTDDFASAITDWWRDAAHPSAEGRARVVLYASNSTRYVAAYIGLLKAEMVPFLVDPALGAEEITGIVTRCGIDAFVHDRDLPGNVLCGPVTHLGGLRLSRVQDTGRGRPELLASTEVCRFTSGSTGFPNCIEFSGTAVHNAARAWLSATSLEQGERVLCFAGLFNGLAFNTSLLPSLLAGATLWVPSGIPSSGHVMRFLRQVEPTRLTGFPALYESLLRRNVRIPELATLRAALSSAAPLRPQTALDLKERHGLAVCNYYGIAEVGPLTYDPEPGTERGVGYPLPGVEFAFGDGSDAQGRIRVRSTSMGSRYLNAPGVLEDLLDGNGYYLTGDEGRIESGRLYLHGRLSKGINIGGRKIDPAEVRAVLEAGGAADSVVFSANKHNGDPMLVAVAAGPPELTEDELRSWCRARLAPYKVPERLLVVRELPTTSLGKPRMNAVREIFTQAAGSGF